MNLCRTLPEVPFARFARSSCGRLFKLGAPSLVLEPLIQGIKRCVTYNKTILPVKDTETVILIESIK